MTGNNLRPDIRITQVFTPQAPVVLPADLPVVLLGLNRKFNVRVPVGSSSWAGSDVSSWEESFPVTGAGAFLGGTVDPTTAVKRLQPKVHISGTYGIAQIQDVTFDLAATPPTFTVAAGADAEFLMTTGVSGTYAVNSSSPSVGTFADDDGDFIGDKVRAGDKIYVGGVATYEVITGGLVSDTELLVTRIDKGPSTAGNTETTKFVLTPEDSNDVRRLIVNSTSFSEAGGFVANGVRTNDLVRIDHWDTEVGGSGATFTYVGESEGTTVNSQVVLSDERVITYPTSEQARAWNNSTQVGGVTFLLNDLNEFYPAFYNASSPSSSVTTQIVKDYVSTPLLPEADEDVGGVFKSYDYARRRSPSATGSFTAEVDGLRTFTDSQAKLSGLQINDHVAVKDTDGIYRPVFVVTASPVSGSMEVEQFTESLINVNFSASNVEYVILNPGAPYAQFLGAGVGKTADHIVNIDGNSAPTIGSYTLSGDERKFTAGGASFSTSTVSEGDLIFSDSGILAYVVTFAPSPSAAGTSLAVKLHDYSGFVLGSGDTVSPFGYSIRQDGNRADFRVRRVVSSTELELAALTTTPNVIPGTKLVKGGIYFQTPINAVANTYGSNPALVIAPDSSSSLSYEVKKTISGADLSGQLLLSYSEVRNDQPTMIEVNSSNYEDQLGPAVPDNPLSLAAQIATANTDTAVMAMQVATDDVSGWTDALDAIKVDTIYSVVPLTQDPAILTLAATHVNTESQPDNKRERILYQSALFPRSTTVFTRNQEEITIERDGAGVTTLKIVGEDFSTVISSTNVVTGTAFNGTEEIEFSGTVQDVDYTGDTELVVLLTTSTIAVSTAALSVVTLEINTRLLTDAQLRDSVADYATNMANRRIRNLYPDNITVNFTDTTDATNGIYSSGEVTAYAAGGFYLCAMEAAKRANYGPAKPLTRTPGAGINTIVDPFVKKPAFQDTMINAGIYYMEQPSGAGTAVQAIRALSTDTTDLVFAEDSVTTQIDNFARLLRRQLRPLVGPYILDEAFFTLISTQQQAVINLLLANKHMKTVKLNSISEDPDVADTFRMNYTVQPFYSGARGDITIYV
jgi:hypothetical protein